VIAWVLRRIIFPLGRPYVVPSDRLGHDVASLLIEPSATRDRLTRGMFIADHPDDPLALIEAALTAGMAAEALDARLRTAFKEGKIGGATQAERIASALAAGILSAADVERIERARLLADRVIHVDDFAPTTIEAEGVAPGLAAGDPDADLARAA